MTERTHDNHKTTGAGTIIDANIFKNLVRIHGYEGLGFDTRTSGGIVRRATDRKPRYYVRAPFWRGIEVANNITTADLIPLAIKDKTDLRPEHVDSGLEAEYMLIDRTTGDVASGVMNDGNPFRTGLQPFMDEHSASAEFPSFTVELNFPHGTEPDERNDGYLTLLQNAVALAEEHNLLLTPLAVLPNRPMTQDDITQNPYVLRLALDVIGWKTVRHFDVSSIQTHSEVINHEAARQTINYKQLIAPLLSALSLSGPAMDGSLTPDVTEVYKHLPLPEADRLKQETMDWLLTNTGGSTVQSYRPFNRFFGSPSGGVMREPLPISEEAYLAKADRLLQTGEIPSPARVSGHHTDRYRPDILPYGTIETCVMDTAGGRIQRVHALREFNRILDWKMQMLFINGQFDQKAQEYQALFGRVPTQDSFETAHWNLMKVAKDGTNAVIEGMEGQEYPVQQLWDELVRFVQEPLIDEPHSINYQGLPENVIAELDKVYQDPREIFAQFHDASGMTSTRGFYETGRGNISQWIIRGVHERIVYQGMTEQEAILAMNIDVGENWHAHVKAMTHADIT